MFDAVRRQAREAKRGEQGFALITVLLVLVLLTGLTTVAHMTTRSQLRIGANHSAATEAYYAAEAGAEHILASIKEAMGEGILSQDAVDDAMGDPPDVPGHTFTEYSATVRSGVVNEKISDGPYAGMWSRTRYLDIVSAVEGRTGSRSRVEMTARALAIPIFQFAVFYDKDFETCPGPVMQLEGRVHSNGHLYIRSHNEQYFHDMITTAKQFHLHPKVDPAGDPTCSASQNTDYLKLNDGSWLDLNPTDIHDFCSDNDPDPNCSDAQDKTFDDYSKANWDHLIQTRSSGIKPMDLPLPTGMDPYEIIQPCTGGESAPVAAIKYACNADIVVRAQGNSAQVESGLSGAKANNFAQFNANAFADEREQTDDDGSDWTTSNRDVVEIDVSVLDASDYQNGIVYVHAKPEDITNGNKKQVVVRVKNGSVLKAPLTIATSRPLYVDGDFNSDDSQWQPAQLAGDAITILSNAWDDSENDEIDDSPRDAQNTTVQAAILAGHDETEGYGAMERGGNFHNFPRFLEDWSWGTNYESHINGSFVSMWISQVAVGDYQCCGVDDDDVYMPPERYWGFDSRLEDPANLPPNTPVVGQLLRVGFQRTY